MTARQRKRRHARRTHHHTSVRPAPVIVSRAPFRVGLRVYHWGVLIRFGRSSWAFGPHTDPDRHA